MSKANAGQHDKQLVNLRRLLSYAVANLLLEHNPSQGVRVGERKNAKAAQLPFDLSALQAIFSSSVYIEGTRSDGGAEEAAYWLPLLALFTEARIEELAQRRPEDVYEESYHADNGSEQRVWVVGISNEGEGQSLKKADSRRRFPLYPKLLHLGFAIFVQS